MEKVKEKPALSADEVIKRMREKDPIFDMAARAGSYTAILQSYVPTLRHLSDHIDKVWVKKMFRDFLNRMEDTMERNGDHLDYEIRDYKYRR